MIKTCDHFDHFDPVYMAISAVLKRATIYKLSLSLLHHKRATVHEQHPEFEGIRTRPGIGKPQSCSMTCYCVGRAEMLISPLTTEKGLVELVVVLLAHLAARRT